MNAATLATVLPLFVPYVVKPLIGLVAISMFWKNYREKKDAESLGWCLLCVLWTL